MQGVLLALAPDVRTVDLTHEVPPQEVEAAAFWLSHCHPYFPGGTVHLAVVDPGVGTTRRALAVAALGHLFVGPDNGIFSSVLARADAVHEIEAEQMRRQVRAHLPGASAVSSTFHGRDVFAPAAALLARGEELAAVGPPLTGAPPVLLAKHDAPRVMIVDRFGNLVTSIRAEMLAALGPAVVVMVGATRLPLVGTYGELDPGGAGALVGSRGRLEIAAREGSAQARLGAGRGTPVQVSRRSKRASPGLPPGGSTASGALRRSRTRSRKGW